MENGSDKQMNDSSEGSLGGQNNRGYPSGARSSRALPTTLFKKLRNLDRQIGVIDRWWTWQIYGPGLVMDKHYRKQAQRREELDNKRKTIRAMRKKYTKE